MNKNRLSKMLKTAVLLLGAAALFACDAENPAAPSATPVAPVPTTTPASATWVISVSANPNELNLAEEGTLTANVVVLARRADNNSPVPNGTTALLQTTAGTLTTTEGAGTSVPIVFDATGTARAVLSVTTTFEQVVVVRAQIENSFGSANVNVVDIESPFLITAISPVSGPPSGGTLLTISGRGFEEPVRATFSVAGQTLLLTDTRVQSETRITARTPAINLAAGTNATASLTLQNAFGSSGSAAGSDTIPSAFTYTRGDSSTTLKIFSVTPSSGPNEGGTRVAIVGEGFGSQMQVFFSNAALVEAPITSVSSTRIEIVTPSATGPNAANANQRVDVRVNDLRTGASVTVPDAFQYGRDSAGMFISSIAPNQAEYLGGDLVTIFGQGFDEPVAVSLANFGQQIISVTGTQIIVRTSRVNIGCSSVAGPTGVTNLETNESATGPTFTYLPILPVITGVTPTSGAQAGGNSVTILGSAGVGRGFVAPLRVLINDQLANVTNVTDTQVTATAPQFTGTFNTVTCTGPGGVSGTQNVPTSVNVRVINLDTDCEDELEAGYTYIPADQTCRVTTTGGGTTTLAANFTTATQATDGTLLANQVRVTDSSTGSPTSWLWLFGDGNTSNAQAPNGTGVHTYAAPGTYNITLTVGNGTSTDAVIKPVTVN